MNRAAAGPRSGRRRCAAGFAIWCGQYPTAQVFGATICRGLKDRKRISLTYDDGPNPQATRRG